MNLEGGAPNTQKLKIPLKFQIEGKEYETFDQYKTGLELKELAGIPLDTELFLSISKPYKDELIENDNKVNLARPKTEYFFVKKKLQFTINKVLYNWYRQYITGSEIREIGQINPLEDIYLDIKEGWQDDIILEDEVVDLARPGVENFFSKLKSTEFIIIVNTREKVWKENTISFEQVILFAFGSYDDNPNKSYTVTYCKGLEPRPEGTMVRESVINVNNKMIFDVSATDKS